MRRFRASVFYTFNHNIPSSSRNTGTQSATETSQTLSSMGKGLTPARSSAGANGQVGNVSTPTTSIGSANHSRGGTSPASGGISAPVAGAGGAAGALTQYAVDGRCANKASVLSTNSDQIPAFEATVDQLLLYEGKNKSDVFI